MLQNIRQISLLNKIFNVRGNEWPKISVAWIITLLYRIGFVIGWTVLVALFVSNYGIASLPYLFVINAAFSIIGSLVYSTFLDKISKELLMVITIFITCAILFAGYFLSNNLILFFALIIVSLSAVIMSRNVSRYTLFILICCSRYSMRSLSQLISSIFWTSYTLQ